MLEPSRHVKAMSNVWVGPPFPLIENKLMFYSLALSKKLSLIHGDFLATDIDFKFRSAFILH
jgi:hypothetical protein